MAFCNQNIYYNETLRIAHYLNVICFLLRLNQSHLVLFSEMKTNELK